MLKDRTTVLVTNLPWIAAQADLCIDLENGTIKSIDKNIGVTREPIEIARDDQGASEALIDNEENSNTLPTEAKPVGPKDPKDDINQEAGTSNGRLMCKKPIPYSRTKMPLP